MATKSQVQDLTQRYYESLIGVPAGEEGVQVARVGFSARNGIEVIDTEGNLFSVWIQKTRQHVDLCPAEVEPDQPKPSNGRRKRQQQ